MRKTAQRYNGDETRSNVVVVIERSETLRNNITKRKSENKNKEERKNCGGLMRCQFRFWKMSR